MSTQPARPELRQVRTPLPGPQSQALFARTDHSIYPLPQAGRRGDLIVDADGNTFADHLSAWGASPFGPTPLRVKQAMDAAWNQHGTLALEGAVKLMR